VVESAILCYVAVWLHRDAVQAAELEYVVASLCPEGNTHINLQPLHARVQSKGALALVSALQTVARSIARVRQSADTIALAADSISSSNTELQDRSRRQADTVQETASSIQQLSAIVTQNASGAAQASQQVASATNMALQGNQAMSQAVQTIGEINSVSSRIADIVTVIDSIAFQTNLLALNAAVEAARAGEQGKGFAVVASEVQSLAQRSAKAAQEIKALIEDSVQAIQSGNEQVTQAGVAIDRLAASVSGVAELFVQIEQASIEQSQGISTVNNAIASIDEAAHHNAGLVDQARVSTLSLQEQANNLLDAVSVFGTHRAHPPAAPMGGTSARPRRLKALPA
ncbi:MAG TPA: methyl-accepting chemotaxis protein, partial [Pusillimonas sp.]|uniref:methyl-accepting chemotaxis protein n=1 Tax=Pusillimonas sp. TaxID=3040095 RepID=UPI002C090828